jgi:hypothetical protein
MWLVARETRGAGHERAEFADVIMGLSVSAIPHPLSARVAHESA